MIAYNVTLIKVESNHSNLRTDEIEGQIVDLPEIGQSLVLIGTPLTEGMMHRLVRTTEIKEVTKENDSEYLFKTKNSTYRLKVSGTEEVK